jgi:hypothetical protein
MAKPKTIDETLDMLTALGFIDDETRGLKLAMALLDQLGICVATQNDIADLLGVKKVSYRDGYE